MGYAWRLMHGMAPQASQILPLPSWAEWHGMSFLAAGGRAIVGAGMLAVRMQCTNLSRSRGLDLTHKASVRGRVVMLSVAEEAGGRADRTSHTSTLGASGLRLAPRYAHRPSHLTNVAASASEQLVCVCVCVCVCMCVCVCVCVCGRQPPLLRSRGCSCVAGR
jgi:hypothetical protein